MTLLEVVGREWEVGWGVEEGGSSEKRLESWSDVDESGFGFHSIAQCTFSERDLTAS